MTIKPDKKGRLSIEDVTETEYLMLFGAMRASAGHVVHKEEEYIAFFGSDREEVIKFWKRFVEEDEKLRNSN